MIGRVLRVIIGFAVACLAAGLAMVLFVYTPAEMASEPASDRFAEAGMLTLFAATQSAVFAAPFAFIGAGFGEWQKISAWLYYTLVAIAIAGVGFLAQLWSETGSRAHDHQQLCGDGVHRHRVRRPASSIGCSQGALRAGIARTGSRR